MRKSDTKRFSYLGLSFPFYYGAPNTNKYFLKDSFEEINILDLDYSIKTIEEGINSKLFEKNLDNLRISRDRVLNEHNLFVRISKIINQNEEKNSISNNQEYKIFNVNHFWRNHAGYKLKIKKSLSRKLRLNH